jgi:hypothetical protein
MAVSRIYTIFGKLFNHFSIMEHNDISNDLILKLNEVTVDKEQQNGQYDK